MRSKVIFCVVLILISCCCFSNASSQTKVEVDGLIYTILSEVDYTCSVSASSSVSGSIRIPEQVALYGSQYKVVSVSDKGFNDVQVDSVFLSSMIESIGRGAFANCSLKYISLNQVKDIGDLAFYNSNISSVIIPNTVGSIGKQAFSNCKELKFAKIEASLWQLPDNMFAYCDVLEEVEMIGDVYSSGGGSFFECINLKKLILPESLIVIGGNSFRDCKSLKSLFIPKNVETIGPLAFCGCETLEEITGGEGVKYIHSNGFGGGAFKSIFFPILEKIEEYAFCLCPNLKEVHLPLSLKEIGSNAFSYSENLSNVYAYSQYPLPLNSDSFIGISPNATLYTPYVAIDRYKSTSVWKDFAVISSFNVPIENLNIQENYLSIDVNKPQFLTLTTSPLNYTSEINWISTNDNILTVDERGKINGKNFGDVKLIVNVENLADTVNIEVIPGFENLNFSPTCDKECSVEISKRGSSWSETVKYGNIYVPEKVYLNNEVYKVSTILDGGFSRCEIDTLVIKSDIRELPTFCFQSSIIDSISLPNQINVLGLGAFNASTVNSLIDLPEVIAMDESAFCAAQLKSVSIGEGITTLPKMTFGFATITDGKLILPNSIRYLGRAALGLTSIKEIHLGDSVLEIDQPTGFPEDMETLICMTRIPPRLINATSSYYYPTLYVPGSSLTAYKQSTWGYYFSDIRPLYVEPTGIKLNFNDLSLHPGDVANLKYELYPEDVDPTLIVTWISSNPEVASVDELGHVNALTVGEAQITARINNAEANCIISVVPIEVEKIELNENDLTLEVGETYQLNASVFPSNASNKDLYWWVDNTDIAIIDEVGLLSVIGEGSTMIHVCSSVWTDVEATCLLNAKADVGGLLDDCIPCNVYSISGTLIRKDVSPGELKNLTAGIYIIVQGSSRYKITK